MNVTKQKCYCLDIQNKPGELTRVTSSLKESNVNLRALWGWGMPDGSGQVMLIPEKPEQLEQFCSSVNWNCKKKPCFCITCNDQVGAMVEPLEKLSSQGINVSAAGAVAVDGKVGCCLWCEEGDAARVASILEAGGSCGCC